MNEKTPHPTQKPEELLRKLILASSSEGDLVLDPFSGSGTTAVVASQLHRQWLACDENPEYNQWAAQRLDSIGPSNSGWPLTETITKEEDQSDDHDIEPTGGMGQRQGTVHHGC